MKKKIIFVCAVVCSLFIASCGGDNELTPTATPLPTNTPAPTTSPTVAPTATSFNTYGATIAKDEIDNLTRADLWAIVPAADALTEDEIKECMRGLISQYVATHKVTAVTLFLADTMDDVNRSSYTLGRCMYYPGGEISNALTTTAGDYSTFSYKYEVRSRASKETPTDREIEIYNYVNSELDTGADEDVINKKAAEKYGITVYDDTLIQASNIAIAELEERRSDFIRFLIPVLISAAAIIEATISLIVSITQ